MSASRIEVRLHTIRFEAQGIHSFELRPVHAPMLPAFTAGAHIDLHLANGLVRSYSLLDPLAAPDHYRIAVNNDPASRGGSRLLHEELRVGQTLFISEPRNRFELDESASHSVLVAGGIGITPLYAMVRRLSRLGRSWSLYYGARTRKRMAFIDELEDLSRSSGNPLVLHADDEQGRPLDVQAIVAHGPADAHWYCCGPAAMLEVFERETLHVPVQRVHMEYFAPRASVTELATESVNELPTEMPVEARGFTVQLARSKRAVQVPPGCSILDALLAAGLDVVPYSCREGVCGTCESRVLAGIPEHRDLVLTQAERAANQTMMVCCSGSRSSVLVLDR